MFDLSVQPGGAGEGRVFSFSTGSDSWFLSPPLLPLLVLLWLESGLGFSFFLHCQPLGNHRLLWLPTKHRASSNGDDPLRFENFLLILR